MAKAPRPGYSRRQDAQDNASTLLRITIRGESHTLAVNNLPMRERTICRKATGLPLEGWFTSGSGEMAVGEDTIAVLWWLARRMEGEFDLTWPTVTEEWPTGLTADDFDVEEITPDDEPDSPEVSGSDS